MLKPKQLEIKVANSGYYSGFNKVVTFGAMIALIIFTIWVVLRPQIRLIQFTILVLGICI